MTQTGNTQQQAEEALLSGEVAITKSKQEESIKSSRWQRLAQLLSANWLLCLLVFGVALVFDLYRLGAPSIWFDEAFSVELARQPLPLLWHIIFGLEPNMELYYLLLHGW